MHRRRALLMRTKLNLSQSLQLDFVVAAAAVCHRRARLLLVRPRGTSGVATRAVMASSSDGGNRLMLLKRQYDGSCDA